MFSRKSVALAIMLALGTAGNAHAAVIIKTLRLTGSGFSGSAGAVGPVSLVFSLNFDNSTDFSDNTSGITEISNNVYGPLKIGYLASNDILSIVGGSNASAVSGGCANGASSFCSFIYNISSGNPTSNFMLMLSDVASSYTTNVSVDTVAAVPEPATWALMLLGLGMAGAVMRRRNPAIHTTVSFA